MVTELIAKYIWLLQMVMDAGDAGLTLGEITGRYERRFGEVLTRRTFVNYKNAVEEVFGIGITCDRSSNRYCIDRGNRMSNSTVQPFSPSCGMYVPNDVARTSLRLKLSGYMNLSERTSMETSLSRA